MTPIRSVGGVLGAVVVCVAVSGCGSVASTPTSSTPAVGDSPVAGWLPTAPASEPTASAALLSSGQLAEFQERFGQTVTLAVVPLDGGAATSTPETGSTYAWSTAKPLIIARLLADVGGPSGLTVQQRQLIAASLSYSDNEAAAELHRQLVADYGSVQGAADAMGALLARAGDTETEVSTVGRSTYSTYGQTRWSATAQAEFMAALARGCVLEPVATQFLLGEMGQVDPSQRWGLGTIDAVAFKGGWGPDPDGAYLVRQMGLVTAPNGNQYAVAIIAHPTSGSFEGGQELTSAAAAWLAENVTTAPAATAC